MNMAHPPVRRRAAPAELDSVRLRVAVSADGVTMPAGSEGVIVAIYGDGQACEVEFLEPVHAVMTVLVNQIA